MNIVNRKGLPALGFVALAGLVSGCATEGPRPVEQLATARASVDAAAKGGNAQRYAAADLQRANDELADANKLDSAGKFDEARASAESATVDANLASARGAAADAQHAATEVAQSNASVGAEAARAADAAAAAPPPLPPPQPQQ